MSTIIIEGVVVNVPQVDGGLVRWEKTFRVLNAVVFLSPSVFASVNVLLSVGAEAQQQQ